MNTPFDNVIRRIIERGYHNHRTAEHSDIVCTGIWNDLLTRCEDIRDDYDRGRIGHWLNQPAPDLQRRRADLLVCETNELTDTPDLSRVRICLENKSVLTAHRNRGERFRDLDNFRSEVQQRRREAIVLGTVMIGTARRYLNVADQVGRLYRSQPGSLSKTFFLVCRRETTPFGKISPLRLARTVPTMQKRHSSASEVCRLELPT